MESADAWLQAFEKSLHNLQEGIKKISWSDIQIELFIYYLLVTIIMRNKRNLVYCKVCYKRIYGSPSRVRKRKFCSRKCCAKHQCGNPLNSEKRSCDYCHKIFLRCKSQNMNRKNIFCSRICAYKFRLGKPRAPHRKECKCCLCHGGNKFWLGKKRDPEMVERMRQKLTGRHLSPNHRKLISISNKNRSPEVIRKSLIRACPSSLESKMLEIINCNKLPYKFVGNGKFMIGRKCPDFINCNGEKIALEVFYRKHKEDFRGGLQNWKRNRSRIFARYGWKIIYFDERMVEENYVLKRLNS